MEIIAEKYKEYIYIYIYIYIYSKDNIHVFKISSFSNELLNSSNSFLTQH